MLEMRMADGRSVRMSIPRREFGQLLASGALGALFPAGVLTLDDADRLATVMTQPSRVDPQVIGYFDRLLTEHYTADQILGPHQLLGPVMAQLDMLDGLRQHARPPVAKPLLRVLGQYAEFVGWLQQDAGDLPAAMYWSDRATQWAQSASDYQMAAHLLVRKSNIAYLADDANTVIELAAAAQDAPRDIDPKITALAAQQEARGWAMINNGDRCRRKLDTAAQLLSTHPDGGEPTTTVYIQYYDLGVLEDQSATCYRSIDRAEDAARSDVPGPGSPDRISPHRQGTGHPRRNADGALARPTRRPCLPRRPQDAAVRRAQHQQVPAEVSDCFFSRRGLGESSQSRDRAFGRAARSSGRARRRPRQRPGTAASGPAQPGSAAVPAKVAVVACR
jgi:hypothetical protein